MPFAAVLQLSSLDGTNGFRINGKALNDRSGVSVASAGDVNGDGYADLIIGAFLADPNGSASGASYVVFGKASGFSANFNLNTLNGANGFQISGEVRGDESGISVASAGDVNGDGYPDLIIGARGGDTNADSAGASYVVFGKASGFSANLNLSSLNGANGFQMSGEAMDDSSGRTVASAGDINGDGYDDLIIGASNASPNGWRSGASYVVFGKASGFTANLNLSALNGNNGFKIIGEAMADFSGSAIASAGDINGDGYADLLIGAHGADQSGSFSGASYVVFGKASGYTASLTLSTLDGNNGFQINGVAAGNASGWSVASAGDVNGDTYADLIIGAYAADGHRGATYVVFGKTSGFTANFNLSSLDGTNGFRIDGEAALDMSGWSVASAGDFNGDGFADLIIGAEKADPNGSMSGVSYVVFGQVSGFGASIHLSALNGANGFRINGESGEDYSGTSVASAGDINGDGYDDLIVGASGSDVNAINAGASYVIFGRAPPAPIVQPGTAGNDSYDGGTEPDDLSGQDGNDTLNGLDGDDDLDGGEGDDILNGGLGADAMIGGLGNDTFHVDNLGDTTRRGRRRGNRHGHLDHNMDPGRQSREPDADRRGGDQRHGQQPGQHPDRQ